MYSRHCFNAFFFDKPFYIKKNLHLFADLAQSLDIMLRADVGYLGRQFDLIINATAASLNHAAPPIPDDILAADGWCYDLMYSSEPTAFVNWGYKQGAARSLDGLGMLVEQAAQSFHLWRGVWPETKPVIDELLRHSAIDKNSTALH